MRTLILTAALAALCVGVSTFAPSSAVAADGCATEQPSAQKQRGSALLGGVLEGLVDAGMRRSGINADYGFRSTMRAFLTDAIACSLTESERTQAASATTAALGKGVGGSTAWTSGERPGVSGESSVIGEKKLADGTLCRTVRNIAIANGEETTVAETYCLANGSTWTPQS